MVYTIKHMQIEASFVSDAKVCELEVFTVGEF